MATKGFTDSQLAGIQAALERAAKRARKIARQTQTPLVYSVNGEIVKEIPPLHEKDEATADQDND